MQSGLTIKNDPGNIQIVAVEFGQAEPYQIDIGFWHRLQRTMIKIILFVIGKSKVVIFR